MKESFRAEILFAILAIAAAVVAACDTRGTDINHQTETQLRANRGPKSEVIEADRQIEKTLAEGKADAREWLSPKHEQHVVWKWSREAALKAVEELRAGGAVNVWVVDVHKEGQSELASSFVVELPQDAASRSKVFAWITEWEKHVEMEDDELTKDLAQKYWVLETDL